MAERRPVGKLRRGVLGVVHEEIDAGGEVQSRLVVCAEPMTTGSELVRRMVDR